MNTLYHETAGTGSALALVHGWGTHGGIWEPMRDGLASSHRLFLPDLPGHGRSRERHAPDLESLMSSLLEIVPERAVWVGWSLGGLAALAIARRAPAHVKALVLIAVTPCFVQANGWPCAMAEGTLAEFARGLSADYRATLSRFLSLQLGTDESARALLRSLRASLFAHGDPSPEGLRAGLDILRTTDLRSDLAAIDMPVLVIHGGRDRIAPVQAAESMAAQLPQAELVVIDDAGHAPHLSHGPAVLSQFVRFLHDHE